MEKDEILLPDNYEDAMKRKAELLEKITVYNEALFSDEKLPYTDDEIKRFQDEYLLLDEYVDLTDKEKEVYEKLDKKEYIEVINEDGKIEKKEKQTFFDKVNPLAFVYAIFPLVGSLWFSIQGIGAQLLYAFIGIAEKLKLDFSSWSENGFFTLCVVIIAVYPIVFCLVTLFIYLFACKKKETKKVFFYILLGQLLLSIGNYLYILIELLKQK